MLEYADGVYDERGDFTTLADPTMVEDIVADPRRGAR